MTDVINAENRVLGRLASRIAREVKEGEEVKVVNSEKAVISGNEEEVKQEYKQKVDRGSRYTGPHYPKSPERILKRTVRGMLPSKEEASNVKTYIGVPEGMEPEEVKVKEGDDLRYRNYVKLGEVSRHVGWTPRGDIND